MTARASFILCLAFSTVPVTAGVFGLYQLATLRAAASVETAAIAEVCLLAYKRTIDTAGHVAIYSAIGLFLFLLVCCAAAVIRGWRETQRIRRLKSVSTDSIKWQTVQGFRERYLPHHSVRLFEASEPMAITVGYFSPRILLSSGLLETLDEAELEAVLHHEAAHVTRRDPLRTFVCDCCKTALPFIPIIRYAASQFRIKKEVEADAAAIAAIGSPVPLASALAKVIVSMPAEEALGVGITPTDARIDALLGKHPTPESKGKFLFVSVLSLPALALLSAGFYFLAHSPHLTALHICSV